MTSGQQPAPFMPILPLLGDLCGASGPAAAGESGMELNRPLALRCLLLLSGALEPDDQSLAQLSDGDLVLLRSSLDLLAAVERTSAA